MVSGEDSRKTFFGTKNLDFTEGYNILLGTVCFYYQRSLVAPLVHCYNFIGANS